MYQTCFLLRQIQPELKISVANPTSIRNVVESTSNVSPSESARKKILVVGVNRGGATFASEMFNQNPEAIYSYELLHYTRKYYNEPTKMRQQQSIILKNYFNNCKNPKIEDFYPQTDYFLNSHNFKIMCRRGLTCFPRRSKTMAEIFLRVNSNATLAEDDFNYFCNAKKITVGKVSNLESFDILEENFKNDPDFFVVYVVRDPRGLFVSKMFMGDENIWKESKSQCNNMKKVLNYIRSEKGSWLKSRIIIIRYEDLAFYPKQQVERVYNFLGIEQDFGLEAVKENFQLLTYRDKMKRAEYYDIESKTVDDKTWLFDTNRESKQTVFKWRWELSLKTYLAIQEGCGNEFFNDMGYQKMNDDSTALVSMRNKKVGRKYSDQNSNSLFFPISKSWYYENPNQWGYASKVINEKTGEASDYPDRKKIIIVSEYRGGATFAAETFQQNKEAIYMFETLYMAQQVEGISQGERRNLQIKILSDYLNDCRYPLVSNFNLRNKTAVEKEKNRELCSTADTCHASRTNSLDEFLKAENVNNNDIPELFTKKCKTMPITATKIIRLQDLSVLEIFRDDPNFFIIYIVRDPRGLFRSRKFTPNYFEGYDDPKIRLSNLGQAKILGGAFLRRRRKILRTKKWRIFEL